MPHEIIELLENNNLRELVVKIIQERYNQAGTLYDNAEITMGDSLDVANLTEEELWDEAWYRGEAGVTSGDIDEAFDRYVFTKMKMPMIIYPDEILTEFYQCMCPGGTGCPGYEHEDFDNLYKEFVSSIKHEVILPRKSESFPICIIPDNQKSYFDGLLKGVLAGLKGVEKVKIIFQEELGKDDSPLVLWQHRDLNICLSEKVSDATNSFRKRSRLNAVFYGEMSPKVLSFMQSSIPEVIQSAIRSLSFLYGEKAERYSNELPFIKEEVLHENKDLIKAFLDSYFVQTARSGKQKKKDGSFDRRIRNAVILLIESDTQRNDAIGLALSVSAIEALLGDKGTGISDNISMNVASLLETAEKRQNAIDFVKDIYDKRSRVLHGEKLDEEFGFRLKARHLASTVLYAIISRLNMQRRLGDDPDTPQKLLENLRKSRFKKGHLFGAAEYNVREYWS